MKNTFRLFAALAAVSLPLSTHAQMLVDDFSGDLSAYTDTRILKATGAAADNTYSWEISEGRVQINTSTYGGIEQYALTRTDFSLGVGFELQADFTAAYTGTQDIGLYVGDGHPTADVREDYIAIYRRDNGELYSRGFNGATELGLAGGDSPAVDTLFIARTGESSFETGYYEGGVRNVLVTREMTNANIGSSIGMYADVRSAGVVGGLDNISIVPEPSTYALIFGVAGLAIAAYRRRRQA